MTMRTEGPPAPALRRAQRRLAVVYTAVILAVLTVGAVIFSRSSTGAALSGGDWAGAALVGVILVAIGMVLVSRPRTVRIYDRIFWVTDGRNEIPVPFEQVKDISSAQWAAFLPSEVVITLHSPVARLGRRFAFRPEDHVGLIAFQEPVTAERLREFVLHRG